jgi:tRNA/tmRNA/rRNA uracil-C5-methylase (TrmA/RlmC/RlmD family)
VDLAPIKESLAKLKIQDRELRDQIAEQNTSVKRIEDHLDRVREATDRNTLEQQELIEDLKGAGHKATFISLIGLGLLAASVAINLALYLQLLPVHR